MEAPLSGAPQETPIVLILTTDGARSVEKQLLEPISLLKKMADGL
jgi:hypothetical protein